MRRIKSLYRFLHPRFQTLFSEYRVQLAPRYGHGLPPHRELYAAINEDRTSYAAWIDAALGHAAVLHEIKKVGEESDSSRPTWNNGFLPGMDIVMLYTMMAELKPKRYVEVGSGNSTKVAYLAKQKNGLETHITSIDPQPRAEMDALADEILRKPFEDIELDRFSELEANDILFIDNSHRILPNSDAMVFFMEVLPRLKKGVVVHIHDIYLPYDYPQFMCDRFYSEQYGLAAYMLANPRKYRTLFPNYFVHEDAELSTRLKPMWEHSNLKGVEQHGGSFWLRIGE